jgi:uncharacterized protein (DUF305 family)
MKTIITLIILFTVNNFCQAQSNSYKNFSSASSDTGKKQAAGVHDTSIHKGTIMDIMRQMKEGIDSLKMTGNADKDYAELMLTHHKAAIDMTELETSFGEHVKVARKAQQIAAVEKKEIVALKASAKRFLPTENLDSFKVKVVPVVASMQHTLHLTPTIDNQFIEMMIVHHQGAIDISNLYLKYAKDVKLKALAQSIIKVNQLEIPKLKFLKPD